MEYFRNENIPDFKGTVVNPSDFTVSWGGQKVFLGFPDSQFSTPSELVLQASSSKQRPSKEKFENIYTIFSKNKFKIYL